MSRIGEQVGSVVCKATDLVVGGGHCYDSAMVQFMGYSSLLTAAGVFTSLLVFRR